MTLLGLSILGDRLVFKKSIFQNPKDICDYVATVAIIWSYYRF